MLIFSLLLGIVIAIAIVTCCYASIHNNTSSSGFLKGYKLVWTDDFNGETLNLNKWEYRYPGKRRESINSKEAVKLDGKGNLIISAYKTADNKILTGMIGTEGIYETKYGYFEIRIKLQNTNGVWSSFWIHSPVFGKKINDVKNSGAEIDVFEAFDVNQKLINHAIHWNGYGDYHKELGFDTIVGYNANATAGFRTYGVKWTPDSYQFYVDGRKVCETNQAVSATNQYMIISLEVDKKQLEYINSVDKFYDEIVADYVKVYQK